MLILNGKTARIFLANLKFPNKIMKRAVATIIFDEEESVSLGIAKAIFDFKLVGINNIDSSNCSVWAF